MLNPREVRWERMFPDELEAALARRPVVYLPYGLCEPHGPQNALGMDALRAHAASCLAAREYGGIVAPASYWHVHEHGIEGAWAYERVGEVRPWVTAVPVWMFLKNLMYHLRTVDMLGFRGAVVFSGHAGPFVEDVKSVVSILQPHLSVRTKVFFSLIVDSLFPDGKGSGGHAGRDETSLLWASDPECVDLSRLPRSDEGKPHFAMGDFVPLSDRRVGEAMLVEVAKRLAAAGSELLEAYDEENPRRPPLTFDEVEALWDEKIRPLLPEMESMKDVRPGQAPPPPESIWHRNWRTRYRG